MTYGWALVLVATIIGIFVFVFAPPSGSAYFTSSDPTKIALKGGSISGGTASVVLQNLTGGSIDVVRAALDETVFKLSPVTLNGRDITTINASAPEGVVAGGLLQFEGITYNGPGRGTISIEYKDLHGFQRSVAVSGESTAAAQSPAGCTIACSDAGGCNDSDSCTVDACDSPGTCSASCSHIGITACTNGDGCCPGSCSSLNDSDCAAECGNNLREGFEVCDLNDLAGQTCITQGFVGGTLACQPGCLGFDTNGCFSSNCGNSVREGSEQCDGTDLNSQTCVSRGFQGGTLGCTAQCAFDANSCTNIAAGLAAYWKFDEGAGTTVSDSSGNGNSGTFLGLPVWQASGCPSGSCLRFDISDGNDNVQVANSASLNPPKITVSAWVKSVTANWSDTGTLVSKRNAYILYSYINSKLTRGYIYDTTFRPVSYTPSSIIAWHLYTFTYDGNYIKFYFDGVYRIQAGPYGAIRTSDTGVLAIGRDDGYARYLNGYMDEIRIYNRALNAAEVCEICKLHAAGAGVTCSCT